MAEQPPTERNGADVQGMRKGGRFPISPGGWMGVAAAIVATAYFVLPEETAQQPSDRKPPPEWRIEVPQPLVNRYEVVSPSTREKSGEERTASAKDAATLKADPGRNDKSRSEAAPPAAASPESTPQPAPVATEPRKARSTASGPPMLYIHVRDDAQRRWAERMVVPLGQRGIHVAGIKVVESGPATRDLRYAGSDEPAEAADVAQALREIGVATQGVRRSDAARGQAPAQHYELWLPPGRIEPPR
jgi:hypothetical protein